MDVGCQRTVEASAAAPAQRVVVQVMSGEERRLDDAVVNNSAHEQTFGQTEDGSARGVDEAAGNGEDPEAHRRGDGELIVGVDAAQGGGPADQILGEHRAAEPGWSAKNRPEGQCSRPAPSFRSRMASSTVAWARWNRSASTAWSSRLVTKAW